MKVLKVIGKILLVILALAAVLAIVIAIFSKKNMKAMNECVDAVLEAVSENRTVTELPAGEYSEMTTKGIMKFKVKQYDIDEIGNLSVMTVNIGFMQMATFVFTPIEKDLPLLSCDYMYILGTRKAFLEVYDLVLDPDSEFDKSLSALDAARNKYAALEDIEASQAWYDYLLTVKTYKEGKTADDAALKDLLLDTVNAYLDSAANYELLPAELQAEKCSIIRTYSDGLIEAGGISTDFFKSSFGTDKTRDFFNKVFFGTER